MKILVVSNYYYPEHTGGVEIVSYNLVKNYRRMGHDVRWMAADVLPSLRKAMEADVPIRACNYTEEKLGFPYPLPLPCNLPKMVSNVMWCDVVHLQDSLYFINVLIFLISKILRKPILITQYAKFIPYQHLYKRVLQMLAYRTIGWFMLSFADRVVFITTNVRANMRYLNPMKLKDVVPLGVDTGFYSPLSSQERDKIRYGLTGDLAVPILLFVGRMVERKGVHLIRVLIEKHPEWQWILVGRPGDYDPGKWRYSNLIYYPFASEDELKKLYSSADLLLHPSVGEGLTLIVSESLAVGTPVVLSEESLYEVDEADHSLFFSVRPDISVIEKKLATALADRDRLSDLRVKCREFAVNRLSWGKMTEKYVTILKDLIS